MKNFGWKVSETRTIRSVVFKSAFIFSIEALVSEILNLFALHVQYFLYILLYTFLGSWANALFLPKFLFHLDNIKIINIKNFLKYQF